MTQSEKEKLINVLGATQSALSNIEFYMRDYDVSDMQEITDDLKYALNILHKMLKKK